MHLDESARGLRRWKSLVWCNPALCGRLVGRFRLESAQRSDELIDLLFKQKERKADPQALAGVWERLDDHLPAAAQLASQRLTGPSGESKGNQRGGPFRLERGQQGYPVELSQLLFQSVCQQCGALVDRWQADLL